LVDARSYLALLYVLMRFPIAFAMVLAYIVLLSTGVSLLPVVGVGVLLLLGLVGLMWVSAIFDRELGRWWFGFELPPMSAPVPPGRPVLGRLRDFLTSRVTWKVVGLYHIEMIAGLLVPVLVVVVGATAVALLLSPLIAWADITTVHAGDPNAPFGVSALVQWLGFVVPASAVQVISVILGLVLAAIVLHASEAIVRIQGSLLANLTGISLSSLELLAARHEAATQQARADRSEQSRRELIVNASHELRTPIASIRGHVDALLDPAGKPTKADNRRYLEIVQRETERLSALVDDLLAVARADSGELKLDVRPTDVRSVAEHVASALAPIAERDRKVKLVTRFDDALPEAMADGDRLGQVLMNLVRNAITYTPEGGLVAVEASPDGPGHVELRVEDTGMGIPPEDLERIFDRFYRTDSSRSRATGGFGLGLSISRDLVQAMGGTIEVTSEPGSGSRFIVKLRRVV
jgi:two-component system, OmpR family, phosphate regulon sensor histidine kinase PhoR